MFLILALTLFSLADCRPNGAPTSVCGSMTPGHGVQQTSANPYSIGVTVTEYSAGTPVTVTISGGQFQGLLIQARKAGTTEIVGTFSDPSESSNLRLLACDGVTGSAVTHSNTIAKQDVTLTWNPPATGVGNVEFVATVAESSAAWWMNTKSTVLSDASGGQVSGTDTTTAAQTPAPTMGSETTATTGTTTQAGGGQQTGSANTIEPLAVVMASFLFLAVVTFVL